MIFSIDSPERRDRPALIQGIDGPCWAYRDLAMEVETRKAALGVRRKSLFFIFAANDLASVAWYLAALETGHAVALLGGELDPKQQAQLTAAYEPEFVRTGSWLEDPRYARTGTDALWRRTTPPETGIHADLALLLSTSGSTGSPKCVRLSRRNLEANACSIREALGIESSDRPLAHLPVHYSYGLSVINSHLLAGAAVVLTSAGLVNASFWETIRRHGVDSFSGVPYTYQTLRRLDIDRVNAPSLRIFTQAGGKLDDTAVAEFHRRITARGGSFWVMYGQTEATARISVLPPCELPRKLGSAGRAIPGGKLGILTDTGEYTTAPGIEGELVYEGPNVMMGYAQERADLMRGDELQGRLHTGDRASLDEDGFVFIRGRMKRDAKIFGHRLNLDDLEAFVKQRGAAAAVAARERVVIFCEFGDNEELTCVHDDLSAWLKLHRSAFDVRRIESLPAKSTGKIDYEALQRLL